jgi:putative tryptophan/tyrosine transport system substrate-binding protein
LPALAAELVGRKVDVIYAFSLPAALAAKAATSTIPIVFYIGADPVTFGLVQSFNRPGGNLTGVLALLDPLHEKRLQLIHARARCPPDRCSDQPDQSECGVER